MRIIVGIFMVLHAIVHLLYLGQSSRRFELESGLVWPDGSWAFSRLLAEDATRTVASILLVVAAAGFLAGGIGVFAAQEWWRNVIVGSAVFSSVVYLLLWDGSFENLDGKGGVGLLINLAILVSLVLFKWPNFGS